MHSVLAILFKRYKIITFLATAELNIHFYYQAISSTENSPVSHKHARLYQLCWKTTAEI